MNVTTEFTPLLSLLGGAMIGSAAVLLLLFQGKIAGITGMLSGAIFAPSAAERAWRFLFLIGMVASTVILTGLAGVQVTVEATVHPALLAIGGALVGIGTALGGGCTSGHGICGLARFSKRSLVAVPVFMASAVVTVYVLRHVIGGG